MPFDTKRHENDGEHSLALALLAGSLADYIDTSLDTGKIAEYALVHDIVEIHSGDTTVWDSDEILRKKLQDEKQASERIIKDFPLFPWIIRKYQEYEQLDTPEKCFIYALDKIYPHILILIADYHPIHPTWEEYKHTEKIARKKISCFPALLPFFDDLCSRFRQKPHFFSTPIPENEQ